MHTIVRLVIFLFYFGNFTVLFAQPQSSKTDSTATTPANGAMQIFLDCRGGCDEAFLRTELSLFNFVRDRLLSDIHILITTQSTANGGVEYTISFIGLKRFESLSDTLRFATQQTDTDDLVRRKLLRILKLGLVRYLARTPDADKAKITFDQPAIPQNPKNDKWNSWVFTLNLNAFMRGERQTSGVDLFGNMSASRITPEFKLQLGVDASYSESKFSFDETAFFSYLRSQSASGLMVISLGENWSAGGFLSASSSTFSNVRWSAQIAPAVEYNVFPYSENTFRQFRVLYRFGLLHYDYLSETLFDKTIETLPNHRLTIALDLRQPWGSVGVGVNGSQFLSDLTKYRVEISGESSVRVIEGLSVRLYGVYALVRDQITLPKLGAEPEDVILQRVQLATSYSYFISVGMSYTFGSIFNNVVNPRFGN